MCQCVIEIKRKRLFVVSTLEMAIEPLEIDGETSMEYKIYPLDSARKSTSYVGIFFS